MAPQLKNTLAVVALAPGASIVLTHNLNNGQRALAPDIIFRPGDDYGISAVNDVNLTVTNDGVNPISGSLLVESWHTVEREFGGVQNTDLPVKPYLVSGGNAAADGPIFNFVFRPGGVDGDNVFSDWATLVAAVALVQGQKLIQFDNTFVSPCVVPAGTWPMGQVEWTGFARPGVPGINVTIADGASLPGLCKIGGDINVTNLCTVTAPIVLTSVGAQQFEFGTSITGDFPSLTNTGPAPFIDASALTAGQALVLKLMGSFGGATPAVQLGASPATVNLILQDSGRMLANMIAGTNVAAVINVILTSSGGILYRQAGWAGNINLSTPGAGASLARPPLRTFYLPNAVNQVATPASAVPFAGSSLGMNATLRFDTTAGDIAQALPLIRAAAPANGASASTPGAIESTGMFMIIKNELGANDVNVTPDAADTIEGGVGPVVIPPGGSRIFQSNGISNWIIVGGWL